MLTITDNSVIYLTDNVTDTFDITFPFWADSDIVVTLRNISTDEDTDLVLTTDFTLTGGSGTTGTLTTTTVYDTGYKLLIERDTSRKQTVDLSSTDDFDAESVEAQLDKTVAMVQEVANISSTIAKGSAFDAGSVDFTLPSPSASKAIKWNADADGFENSTYDPDLVGDYATAAEAAKTAAEAAQTAAEAAQDAAETSAATINLPDISGSTAGQGIKVNSGKTGYEFTNFTNNADTDVSGNSWVIDEDNMVSDLNTKVPTQQSVKKYVDDSITGVRFTDRNDPATVDFAVGDLTTDGNWHDLDLSSIVGAGKRRVLLRVLVNPGATIAKARFRKNGLTNEVNVGTVANSVNSTNSYDDVVVYTDASGVIEYNADSGTWTTLDITVADYITVV